LGLSFCFRIDWDGGEVEWVFLVANTGVKSKMVVVSGAAVGVLYE